jgi:hypothetical protein
VEPEQGAIRGDDPGKPQPDAWEAAKIDLSSEERIRGEMERAGEPPAGPPTRRATATSRRRRRRPSPGCARAG